MRTEKNWKEITVKDFLQDNFHDSLISSISNTGKKSLLFKFKRFVRRVPFKVNIPLINKEITMYDDPPMVNFPHSQLLIKGFDSAEFSNKFDHWNNPEFDTVFKTKKGFKMRIFNACPPKNSKNTPNYFTIDIKGKKTKLFFQRTKPKQKNKEKKVKKS